MSEKNHKRIIIIAALLLLFLLVRSFLFSIAGFHKGDGAFLLRVRIAHDIDSFVVSSTGTAGIEYYDASGAAKTERLRGKTEVRCDAKGIKIGDEACPSDKIRLMPGSRDFLGVNGVLYRGELEVSKSGGDLDVLNIVELEDYLKGVLPKEVNHLWPFEAIKAQAVTSRSFAVYRALRNNKRGFDLTADTFSQVYGGKSAEKWRTNKAVDSTNGKVLTYAGKILPAYFHSCCGGHTENSSLAWGENTIVPLEGVSCRWCKWSPYYRWQARISTREIIKRLRSSGYEISRIDDIKAGAEDRSGRLSYVSIRSGDNWFDVEGTDFMNSMGTRVVRSTNFRVKRQPFSYRFIGYGWGHGVGLCQWGAFGQALRWKKSGDILQYYYPGTEIADLKELDIL